jgi:uncharacterized MAPEG superfamily protein
MTIAYWCVLVAGLLPYVATAFAKIGGERYTNRYPRAWLDKQQGFRARANSAQANGFEAFPLFAAAVVVAHLAHAPQGRIDLLALIFIVARVAYTLCYLVDWHWARSSVWLIGLLATLGLFIAAA